MVQLYLRHRTYATLPSKSQILFLPGTRIVPLASNDASRNRRCHSASLRSSPQLTTKLASAKRTIVDRRCTQQDYVGPERV